MLELFKQAPAPAPTPAATVPAAQPHRVGSDALFLGTMFGLSFFYVVLILGLLAADMKFVSWANFKAALGSREIQYSIRLSLVSCSLTALLSLWVAIPIGYVMSRHRFPAKSLIDAVLDIPVVLPPLVIGLSLLILFQTAVGKAIEQAFAALGLKLFGIHTGFTYKIPAVILAQFMVACAFAVRTMRVTFDQISTRHEQVAQTLGCSRGQAFWLVILPQTWRGILTAGTLAWARALGEFGPILIFAGATRMRTEVLPTTVFLELSIGNIEAAVAVSMLMVLAALIVLVLVRVYGSQSVIKGEKPQ